MVAPSLAHHLEHVKKIIRQLIIVAATSFYRPRGHANGSCGVRSKVGRRTLLTMLGTSTQSQEQTQHVYDFRNPAATASSSEQNQRLEFFVLG
jgi:hypothetical protein